jgi:hypothetical protein
MKKEMGYADESRSQVKKEISDHSSEEAAVPLHERNRHGR